MIIQLQLDLERMKIENQIMFNQYNSLAVLYNQLLKEKEELENQLSSSNKELDETKRQNQSLQQKLHGDRKLINQDNRKQKKAKDYDHLTKKFDFR